MSIKNKLSISLEEFRKIQKNLKSKGVKVKKPRSHPEEDLQIAIFEWASANEARYPKLKWLNGSLNGLILGRKRGNKANKLGRRVGFPDINLPCRGHGHNGLYIELKSDVGRQSKDQIEWEAHLRSEGYSYALERDFNSVVDLIKCYLES